MRSLPRNSYFSPSHFSCNFRYSDYPTALLITLFQKTVFIITFFGLFIERFPQGRPLVAVRLLRGVEVPLMQKGVPAIFGDVGTETAVYHVRTKLPFARPN